MAPTLWWVTDEWSSSLKSRVKARLVKHEEMSDKKKKNGRERWEKGREEKKNWWGGEGGGGLFNKGKRQTVKIHKVGEGWKQNVCGRKGECVRESILCIFAWVPLSVCIVALNMQKARITQMGNNPRPDEEPCFCNRPPGLHCTACRSLAFHEPQMPPLAQAWGINLLKQYTHNSASTLLIIPLHLLGRFYKCFLQMIILLVLHHWCFSLFN